ncbi:MAG TPA: hypothetical protein PKA28_03965 [Methylomusa anaerophila]|uniref:Uncharacterized protein n=1 Tax=Methylomusa anaerophila TaxID=1930071 RepID=A0A348ANB2_9FIRM|nr:hypothetical protein [Methylomusa anaerophila]BBB92560.1 hypothetical protein MAMMFC1_03255 [Methylomusa anaerophila]HML87585.1 hypothetical protein [Methylomusa anaerophila]
MSALAISPSAQHLPIHQATAAMALRVKDNDGDYDNGTGRDDAVRKTLQAAAQPHLGANVNIKV